MSALFQSFKCEITPITPIHIGSGEVISPGEYFILNDETGVPTLYAVDMGNIAGRLSRGRETLIEWIQSNPIGWVAKVRGQDALCNMIRKYATFTCDVIDRVAENIQSHWGQPERSLEINLLQRPGRYPIIPGSSIKGAIRTALLWAGVEKPLTDFPKPPRANTVAGWERKRLGSGSEQIQDDPLRHLKVSDATAAGVRTIVLDVEHVGMKSNSGEDAGVQDLRECLPDTLEDSSEYSITARLTIQSGHPHFKKGRTSLSREAILSACRDFYGKVLEADVQYWRKDRVIMDYISEIKKRGEGDSAAVLIRLGWGSGMDAMGLNLAKPSGKHPPRSIDWKYRYDPNTRRLINGVPPGWALMRLEKE